MKKKILFALAIAVCFALTATAQAQDRVLLKLNAEAGQILKYTMKMGGTVNFDLSEIPTPGSKIKGENLIASLDVAAYLDTLSFEDNMIAFDVKANLDGVTLGELLQITDLATPGAPCCHATLMVTPQGKIEDLQIEESKGMSGMMPGGMGGMMSGMGMDMGDMGPEMLIPVLVTVLPDVFPETEVAVGESWTKKLLTEEAPIPFMPEVEFNFTLDSVEGDIANLSFSTVGTFDASFLKNFLAMIPEIPMGENIMAIKDINLVVPWDIKGKMTMNVAAGRCEAVEAAGTVGIDGGAKIKFTLPDQTKKPWEPTMKIDVAVDASLKFAGYVERDEYDALFPPPEEEETEGAEEETGDI